MIATALSSITASIGVEYVTLVIIAITLVLFAMDRMPVGLTAMLSAVALGVTGCIAPAKVYAGWTNTMTIMVMCMIVVGDAMFQSGAVTLIGRVVMRSKFASNERAVMAFFMIVGGLLSAFLSNTAVMACFIPLASALAGASNGKIKFKHIMMPMGIAIAIGGTLTLVGSTSQPMVNTVLTEAGRTDLLGMFDFVPIVLPSFIIVVVYFLTIGYKMMPKVFDFEDPVQEVDLSGMENFKPTWRTWLSCGVMVFCVYGFITGLWNVAVIACVGATIVLVSGCCDFKDSFRRLDWNTVFVMAFSQAIAAAMNDTGAGKMIAQFAVNTVGNNLIIQFVACVVIIVILTNIMSNTATAAMMAPIYLLIAAELGVQPAIFMMAIAVSTNLATATPLGASPMTMSLQGGYRFKDYLKLGLPLTVIVTIVTIVMCIAVYGFVPV